MGLSGASPAQQRLDEVEACVMELVHTWNEVDVPDALAQEALDRLEPYVERLRKVIGV